jgi:hypothetical protein
MVNQDKWSIGLILDNWPTVNRQAPYLKLALPVRSHSWWLLTGKASFKLVGLGLDSWTRTRTSWTV